jgi:hypothetical protein
MSSAARSDIANAIWLCGNCHKLIDDDENRYPPGLLFEWVKQHEERIAQMVGKASAEARSRYEQRHLEEFGKLSYRAERLLVEKPPVWEYRLTEEVLRFEMAPVLQRWRALSRGLYARPTETLSEDRFTPWILARHAELNHMAEAFNQLLNAEFAHAWGPMGHPGNEQDIVFTCRLYAEMCASALTWEEAVRFARVDGPLEKVLSLYRGVAGTLIDEAAKLPTWLSDTFSQEGLSGEQRLSLVIDLPTGWAQAVTAAYAEAQRAYKRG